jgi:putative transcriptional regulator
MSRRACLPVLVGVVLLLPLGCMRLDAALITHVPSTPNESRKPAPGMFLVATRSFQDPDFNESVVYLLQHDTHASFGVIVNRPTPVRLSEWLPDIEGTTLASRTVYDGGPVNPEMMVIVLENRAWENDYEAGLVRHVLDGIFASVNPVIVERLLHEKGRPFERVRFYYGHIGWVPGQLEQELEHHYWHLVNGNADEVFGPEAGSLWQRLIERLEPSEPLLSPEIPLNPGLQ